MKEKTTRRNSTPVVLPDFGKVPPQANEMEMAVLGAIMIDYSCMDEISNLLAPGMFYREGHQKIYAAAEYLYKKNQSADLYSVTEVLRANTELDFVGGPVYVTQLTSKVVTTGLVMQHALYVKQKYIQRELIRISTELQTRAFDDTYDIIELLEYAEREIYNVGGETISKEAENIHVLLNNLADIISKRESNKSELIGVPSGITELDRVTMGWQPGDLTILASRPSMGKSALAIQFGRFAAQMKHPTLLFSLEMTDLQLGERFMSSATGLNAYDLKRGRNIDWPKIERLISDNQKTPLWIDDSAHMSIYEFRSKVRRAKKKWNIELVICDYLNLFTGDEEKDNMSEKYGSISKMFKRVAKECKVAVIALAQLNRSPDQRTNQFPKLSDLRNSGEIEQDADIVIFPVRYKMAGMLRDERDRDLTNLARIDIAKNRSGRTDFIEVAVSEDCLTWGVQIDPVFATKEFNNIDFTEPKKDIPF